MDADAFLRAFEQACVASNGELLRQCLVLGAADYDSLQVSLRHVEVRRADAAADLAGH